MPERRAITPGNRRRSHIVRTLAVEQDGVVARAQLVERGVSGSAIDRALGSGSLHRLHPGVYSVVVPELMTEDGRLVAALLAAGRGAFLSHGTAAWRWRIVPAPPHAVAVAIPHRRGVPRPGDIVLNGRFPSTSVARTLLDLAVRYERPALLRALAEAEFQHDLRPADVVRVLRRGHPGSANLRAALGEHAPGHGEVKSRLERRFRALLIRHRIELPERNQRLGPWVVDCLWRHQRVVVELDGRQHERPHQADIDDDRDLWLRRHGFIPRRYGTRQVVHAPDAVIADLLETFADGACLRSGVRGTLGP